MICSQSETCYHKSNFHKIKSPYRSEKDGYNEYLLSFELEPGSNTFFWIKTKCSGFLWGAIAPIRLYSEVDIKPNSITYLGHIDAILRKKKSGNEKRAATFPLIDAQIAGYTTGTFDVVVKDRFDEDMKSFISEYPELQNFNIEKSILPKWIRPENRETK